MRSLITFVAGLAACLALAHASAAAPTPPSARDLTRAASIDSVTIAPDGKHIAALSSPDGDIVDLVVWSTDNLAAPPVRVRTKTMRFLGVRFLKNDRLLVQAVQTLTVEGQAGHLIKQYVTDLQGKSFATLLPDHSMTSDMADAVAQLRNAQIVSTLPRDPTHVMVEDERLGGEGDIYLVDVYSMAAGRILKGSDKYDSYLVDLKGELRARSYQDFDGGALYFGQQIRDPDTGQWVDLFRVYAKQRSSMQIVGFTPDPHVILVASTEGGDKTGIFEYDIKQRKITEPAFQHKMFEAGGVVYSRAAADFGRPLGFRYEAEDDKVYWLDPNLDAFAKSADKALGVSTVGVDWVDPGTGLKARIPVASGADVSLEGWSDDFKNVILVKSGPRQPPEYYLLSGGKLALLGKSRPWIDTAALGDTRLVEYPARDGLMIPAFLTTPPPSVFGPGPYPTLIEPHGGPWARDDMDWDISGWIQYFAARGYAVLQPQFRGSEGWGMKLWTAGDREWGQKMQDDNDDGVKWLVDQHIADAKRVAIFGYSYGGYAALAASVRPHGLYQCAVSGAGAGDLTRFVDLTYDGRFTREFQMPTVAGLNPMAHAKEVQIPVLLYHGDHDTTVDPEQSRQFAAAAKASGKFVKLVEIKDMGHQYVFMTPAMMLEQLDLVDGFLKTDCKPGGL